MFFLNFFLRTRFACFFALGLFLCLAAFFLAALTARLLLLFRRYLQTLVFFLISLWLIFRLNGLTTVLPSVDQLPAVSWARIAK